MDEVLERIEGVYQKLIIDIEKYEYNISRIQTLDSIVRVLSTDDSYKEKNNKLTFLKDQLLFVFDEKKANSYYEIIKMTIIGLIKCENNRRVEEYNYDDLVNRLLDSISLIKNDIVQIKEENTRLKYPKKKEQLDSINTLRQIVKLGYINNDIISQISTILKNLEINSRDIVLFCEEFRNSKREHVLETEKFNSLDILKYQFRPLRITVKYDDVAYARKIYSALLVDLNDNNLDKVMETIKAIDNKNVQSHLCMELTKYYKEQYDAMCALLDDIELYLDDDYRRETLEFCQQYIDRYNRVYNLYLEITNKKDEEDKKIPIAFAHFNGDSTYFLRDLENFDSDFLGSVQDLLDDVIKGSPLVIRKKLTDSDSTWEFKYNKANNQLRIIFYYCGGIPVIFGVMRKRDNNDEMQYSAMIDRCRSLLNDPVLLEEFDTDYQSISKYIEKNKRVGRRK